MCNADEVAAHIGDAHIAVPFMAKLDAAVLAAGRQLRLVIQYGVGVEGTDMAAVRLLMPDAARVPLRENP